MPDESTDTFLLDNNGRIVHTWPGRAFHGRVAYLEPDGTLIRAIHVAGTQFPWAGGDIQRVAYDGTVLWDYRIANATQWAHHDVHTMPNGNVLVIVWDRMTAEDAIAAGRDPALLSGTEWLPDSILEVRQTGPTSGVVVWEWHVVDHLIQDFDPTKPNYGVVADHPELINVNFPAIPLPGGVWQHCNKVHYDPINDLIVLNSRHFGEFYLIDHSTTTAEAAGHTGGNYGIGGDILYRWGNPQAYGRGNASDQKLFLQHSAYIIPPGFLGAGNVLIFNNRAGQAVGQNWSSVVEVRLPSSFAEPPGRQAYRPRGFAWEYIDPVPTTFYSPIVSSAERLPNGNTLICSGVQPRIFEVDPTGRIVWEAPQPIPMTSANIQQAVYYERYLWADRETMSASTGGVIGFYLAAGTRNAGGGFVMLGTFSGTTPGTVIGGVPVPINPDGYTLATAGSPTLPSFVGILDALGNGTSSLALPPLPALAGLTMHHAYVAFSGSAATLGSNAVPLRFVR